MERPSEGRCTKQNTEHRTGKRALVGGNKKEWRVFCCNMPHCTKCTIICFKFIHKPITRFYVPLVVNSKIMIFWDIIPCSSVGCFHLSETLLASTFSSVSCIFYPKMEENGNYLTTYMVIYSRRPCQSCGVILTAFIHKRYSQSFLYMCGTYAANLPSKTVN